MTHFLRTCINTTSIRRPFERGSVRILQDSSYLLQIALALVNNFHRGNELFDHAARLVPHQSKAEIWNNRKNIQDASYKN